VAADEEGLIGLAVEGEPEVSCGIEVGFDGEFGHFAFQPIARGLPDWGEGDALGSIVVAGEGAEFLQVRDRPFRVE
jgi:sugar lactone lactonase YvrE